MKKKFINLYVLVAAVLASLSYSSTNAETLTFIFSSTPAQSGPGFLFEPSPDIYNYIGYYGSIDSTYYYFAPTEIMCTDNGNGECPAHGIPPIGLTSPPKGHEPYHGVFVMPDSVTYYFCGQYFDEDIELFTDSLLMDSIPRKGAIKTTFGSPFYGTDVCEVIFNKEFNSVNGDAFYGADKLTTLTFPYADIVYISGDFFRNTAIEHFNLKKDAILFVRYTALNNSTRKEVDLSANRAYYQCQCLDGPGIESLKVRSDSKFELQCFSSCPTLKKVHLVGDLPPANPACALPADAFWNMPALETFIVDWTTPPVVDADFITTYRPDVHPYENVTVYVPDGSVELYRQAEVWKNYKHILPKSQLGAVTDITAEKTAVSTRVYDLQGRPADATTARGILIKQTTWSDGTVTTDKLVR